MPIKTIEEWNAEIKALSLDGRTVAELEAIRDSASSKIPRVEQDLKAFRLLPDAKRKEIYDSLVSVGEIEEEPEDALSLSSVNQTKVDEEFNSQLQFYTDKIARLEEFVTLSEKEMELREKRLVVRLNG